MKGIPAEKTEADVKMLFERFGTVTNVFFIKDKVSKQSRGFGFVEFEEAANASNALSLDGSSELGGARPLMVKPARPQTQQSGMKPRGFGGFNPMGNAGYGQAFAPYGAPQMQYGNQARQFQQYQMLGNIYGTTQSHGYGYGMAAPAQTRTASFGRNPGYNGAPQRGGYQ